MIEIDEIKQLSNRMSEARDFIIESGLVTLESKQTMLKYIQKIDDDLFNLLQKIKSERQV